MVFFKYNFYFSLMKKIFVAIVLAVVSQSVLGFSILSYNIYVDEVLAGNVPASQGRGVYTLSTSGKESGLLFQVLSTSSLRIYQRWIRYS